MWAFVWRDLIVELRDEFRCVAIDFPGHGLSQAAPGYSVGLRNHADVLAAFVENGFWTALKIDDGPPLFRAI